MDYAKKYYLYAILLFPLLFSGCIRTYYPMHYAISLTPMTFETEHSKDKISKYVGAELTTSSGYHKDETILLASAMFSTAFTTNHSNINLEALDFMVIIKLTGLAPNLMEIRLHMVLEEILS